MFEDQDQETIEEIANDIIEEESKLPDAHQVCKDELANKQQSIEISEYKINYLVKAGGKVYVGEGSYGRPFEHLAASILILDIQKSVEVTFDADEGQKLKTLVQTLSAGGSVEVTRYNQKIQVLCRNHRVNHISPVQIMENPHVEYTTTNLSTEK